MSIISYLEDSLLMEEEDLLVYAKTAPHRYKKYKILKRNSSGTRDIAQPSRELKFIQREIVNYFENILPIHDCAKAYKKGMGIKENALAHMDSPYLLKMDFKEFFPSITPFLFFKTIDKIGVTFDGQEKELLSSLLFYKIRRNSPLRLSIGAPSSPYISNFIMFFFDNEIKELCRIRKINYTRYADDLTFSTKIKDNLYDFPEIVVRYIKSNSLGTIKVNKKKTKFSSKRHNRHVTGITLTNENTLSIGRDRKRLISSMIHKYSLNILKPELVENLLGLLSFAHHIEPNFYLRMQKKYGEDVLARLKEEN